MKKDNFSFLEMSYIGIFYCIGMIAYVVIGLAGSGLILGWIATRDHYFKNENKKRGRRKVFPFLIF